MEPDLEKPYIDAAKASDLHEHFVEKAYDWLWDSLRHADRAETMADEIDAQFGNFGELVALVADLRKAMAIARNANIIEVRQGIMAGLAEGFIKKAQDAIEKAYAFHITHETERMIEEYNEPDCDRTEEGL